MQQNLLMRNKHITQINVYHTPDKGSRPDLKNRSHLKTTIPSVLQNSQSKYQSQYGVHHGKNNENIQYEFPAAGHVFTEKKASKNQWQLKQKVDEYETQIGLLREYLRSCQCNCTQKNSISRIFGLPQERSKASNQPKVVKQLSSKVRNLIKQNNSSKYENYGQLNIQQIIQQNHKLQNLLQKYKQTDTFSQGRQNQKNQLLKEQIRTCQLEYQQRMKLIQSQHQDQISQLRANQHELLRKIQLIESQSLKGPRNGQTEHLNRQKVRQAEETYARQLRDTEALWKRKLEDQQQHYQKIKGGNQPQDKQLTRMKQQYQVLIQGIESAQKIKFERLSKDVNQMDRRIDETNDSMAHLKFQRENRIQSTVRKSRNLASVSPKPKGQDNEEQLIPQESVHERRIGTGTRPLSFGITSRANSSQVQILNQKISYLQKQIDGLMIKLTLSERLVTEKNQRVIILQNQVRRLNVAIANLAQNLNDAKHKPLIRQVVKQVPVGLMPKQYTEQVRNIKQTIISCNLANFDVFQQQFNQIIDQRNQMSQKLSSIRKQAKQSSKALILEKHLKVQRQRNKQLQQNFRRYENQIQSLKLQVVKLQNQIQNVNARQIIHNAQQIGIIASKNMPDGKAGLQWQKIVNHCLMTSISRLQNLQDNMRQDMNKNK